MLLIVCLASGFSPVNMFFESYKNSNIIIAIHGALSDMLELAHVIHVEILQRVVNIHLQN